MKGSFEHYKTEVSIIQVAESLGYKLNRKAGRNPAEYKHPDFATIVIYNPADPTSQRYFTRHSSEDKGSVIDFVLNRLDRFQETYQSPFEGVNKVLEGFSHIPFEPVKARFEEHSKKEFNPKDYVIRPAKLEDLEYLRYRGLSNPTLEKFLPYIHVISNSKYNNLGFPLQVFPEGKIVGYEQVNFSFKGYAAGSNKKEGLWIADFSGVNPSLVRKVFWAESVIDSMSFYQLHSQKYKTGESVFLSTGGHLTKQQAETGLSIFSKAKHFSLFDRDLAGHIFDIRLGCYQVKKEIKISAGKEAVQFNLNQEEFSLPTNSVSMTRIRDKTGIRPQLKVLKSKGKDFNEDLAHAIGTPSKSFKTSK